MIIDMLRHRCTIYRRQGANFDLAHSEDGMVIENWGIVASNVRCLFAPEDTPYQRRPGGITDIGQHSVIVQAGTNVINADRIYWADSETGPAFYDVIAVEPKRDRFLRPHHTEVILSHVDWIPPAITVAWESS